MSNPIIENESKLQVSTLNEFANYAEHSQYQSKIPQRNYNRYPIQQITHPEISKISSKLDMLESQINEMIPEISKDTRDKKYNYSLQVNTKVNNVDFQSTRQSVFERSNNKRSISIDKSNIYDDFTDFQLFKEFLAAKYQTLNKNQSMNELYQYYVENDINKKVSEFKQAQQKVSQIMLQK